MSAPCFCVTSAVFISYCWFKHVFSYIATPINLKNPKLPFLTIDIFYVRSETGLLKSRPNEFIHLSATYHIKLGSVLVAIISGGMIAFGYTRYNKTARTASVIHSYLNNFIKRGFPHPIETDATLRYAWGARIINAP